MARKTKAQTRSSASKTKPTRAKGKSATRGKQPTKTTARRKSGSRKGGATEVEGRWADYLQQRTALEAAVEAVRAAVEQLASAREIEALRRKEFDDCKQSLEQLLEVEAAAGSRAMPRGKTIDFPDAARLPTKPAQHEATPG